MAWITDHGGVAINPNNPIGSEPSSSAAAQVCLDLDGMVEIPAGEWKFTTPLSIPRKGSIYGEKAIVYNYGTEFASWSADSEVGTVRLKELWNWSGTQTVFNVNKKLSNHIFDIQKFQCRSPSAPMFKVVNDGASNTGSMFFIKFAGSVWEQHEGATEPAILVDVNGNRFSEITFDISQIRGSANSVWADIRNKVTGQYCFGIRIRGCGLEKMIGGAFHFYGCSGIYIDNPHGYDLTDMAGDMFRFDRHPGGNPTIMGAVGYRRMIADNAAWTHQDMNFVKDNSAAFTIIGGGGHSTAQNPRIQLSWENGHKKTFADNQGDSIKEVSEE